MGNPTVVVKGKELPWSQSKYGKMRWYMHPELKDRALQTLAVYMQELPPGGRSAKIQQQGEVVIYLLEGEGYSIVDGARFDWKPGDCINLPSKLEGVVHQHFNKSPSGPARFIVAIPNLFDSLGVDMGCGLEVLEEASS
ncbi:MAG: cupin domain-containing protein [Candidatus Tectomicrobia bacterium]|uniref:Cupin domain-containing protein n=1 Tax=Tectimicrobiota bacterium TaxID=2528274 RepID=A0A932LZN2_UNCTE|nr:cupin domain-containing protein [Candidatus Tectomicrobia bacterium]